MTDTKEKDAAAKKPEDEKKPEEETKPNDKFFGKSEARANLRCRAEEESGAVGEGVEGEGLQDDCHINQKSQEVEEDV